MELSSAGDFWVSNAHKITPAVVGVENKGFAFFEAAGGTRIPNSYRTYDGIIRNDRLTSGLPTIRPQSSLFFLRADPLFRI